MRFLTFVMAAFISWASVYLVISFIIADVTWGASVFQWDPEMRYWLLIAMGFIAAPAAAVASA